MTGYHEQDRPRDGHDMAGPAAGDERDLPLDPWMLDLVREASAELDAEVAVPREMMWARIRRERTPAVTTPGGPRGGPTRRWRHFAAAVAVLVSGVAIGRYVLPSPKAAPLPVVTAADRAPAGLDGDPTQLAMQEHLVRTVALLTTVRDAAPARNVAAAANADLTPMARELLTTTRLLLDQPPLRDERTRRLLQDLELVLVQIIQARASAPETQRAPRETLRETNLLTRVNALVTAAATTDAAISGED